MNFFVTCPKGVEWLLQDELTSLGISEQKQTVAGVYCEGELEDLYRVCLWSRLANRVLLLLVEGEAKTAQELYDCVQQVDWLSHLRSEGTLTVDFNGTTKGIKNTQFGAQKVKDAIVDQIRAATGGRPSVDKNRPDIRINVHLRPSGTLRVSLDFSGESLHRRGYRLDAGAAPLKENLAAAILMRSRWMEQDAGFEALLDPMCGSATLLIEAALMAGDMAPGAFRKQFGFSRWLGHHRSLWQSLLDEAQERADQGRLKLTQDYQGYDSDSQVIKRAKANIRRAGLSEFIKVKVKPLESLDAQDVVSGVKGLVVTNPPYGERLGEASTLMFLYRDFGLMLKRLCGGWEAGVFTSNINLGKAVGMRAHKQYKLYNGALESALFLYEVAELSEEERAAQTQPVQGQRLLSDGATMFANRLDKNLKQSKKWRKKNEITCFRAYDADIPEYAVAVDVYNDQIHVQEYVAPKSIDEVKAFSRLHDVMAALPQVFDVDPSQVHLKKRKRQQGSDQYEKQNESGESFVITEHGCQLWVNLTDYLDTGLFLDHRPVRHQIQKMAKGKDVLNLFCYTATATVHAAVGGAKSTTSVDMSSTYLAWGEKNMALNNQTGAEHNFVRADCTRWLFSQPENQFDLIFMDPPTFSNSKRMENTFDVQRDHELLIEGAMKLLRPEGVLIFSNNFRRFKLDEKVLAEFDVKNITPQTIDPDFARNPKIHQCFEIRHKSDA